MSLQNTKQHQAFVAENIGTSSLDTLRTEIEQLRKELTQFRQSKDATRFLDLQLQNRAMREHIKQAGLWADFRSKNPSIN
jgi:hypothetical protein